MNNLRGILFMILAMAGFALEDLIIKMLSSFMPISQILIYIGVISGLLLGTYAKIKKIPIVTKVILTNRSLIMRTFSDGFGAIFIVTAIALVPLSTVSSILQITPLLVTFGAAVIFKEHVGWRRWSAVFVGFLGVILILKPGMSSFQLTSLLALLGAGFLALRDLVTRKVESDIPSLTISVYAFIAAAVGGIIAIPFCNSFVFLTPQQWTMILGSSIVACFSYLTLVLATRIGDISVISPFRYTRLIFAIMLAVLVLNERPDALTLTGVVIIIASGCYTFWRENIKKK